MRWLVWMKVKLRGLVHKREREKEKKERIGCPRGRDMKHLSLKERCISLQCGREAGKEERKTERVGKKGMETVRESLGGEYGRVKYFS